MNKKDILIGGVILIALAGAIFLLRRNGENNTPVVESTPSTSIEQKIEDAFKVNIPEDADKAELKAADGNANGIATRSFENGQFQATVLADLPDEENIVYQAWVTKADNPEERVLLGSMRIAKGGYLIEYQSNRDLTEYKKVSIVTRDSKVVLEGSFN